MDIILIFCVFTAIGFYLNIGCLGRISCLTEKDKVNELKISALEEEMGLEIVIDENDSGSLKTRVIKKNKRQILLD